MVQQKVCPVRGEYAIMNRQELLAFFLEKRKENINFCKNCKKGDFYSCNRFLYIRDQLEKKCVFYKRCWTEKGSDAAPTCPMASF